MISWYTNTKCEIVNDIDGLMQKRCNSIANALELRLSCINPSIFSSILKLYQSIIHIPQTYLQCLYLDHNFIENIQIYKDFIVPVIYYLTH